MDELKPCPFCGGKAEFINVYPPFGGRRSSVVQCTHCRCNSGKWGRSDKAIKSWNRRVADENELFGNSEQLDCSDCVNHGGDWDCDHVQCRKGTDTISRQAAIDLIEEVENKRLRGEIDLTYAPMIKGIKALPPAQRWVLATPETMPDSYEIVYVTVSIEKRRYVTKGVVANGKWVGNFGGGRVVAWTPITYPKPYNGEFDG